MLRNLVLLGCGVVLLSAASAPAQDAVLGQLYGSGVHAYFAGDFAKSYDQLSAAVAAGSRDPRVHYFRGLTDLKLGRAPEAAQDFQKGAELESKDLNRSFNVARSLERIQGPARQQLETYRVEARLAALAEAAKVRKARFEAIQREEQRVLRNQAAAASENVPAPEGESGDKPATDAQGSSDETKPAAGAAADDKAEMPADSASGGGEKAADKPKATPFEEEPVTTDKAATPAVEKMDGDKPAAPERKSGPVKQSILGALIKSGQSELKKTIGGGVKGLGGLVPGGPGGMGPGMGPGGMAPGTPVTPGAPAPGPGFGDFGAPGDEKAAPPQKAAPEKPADKPAGKPTEEKDPFDT